MQKAGGAHGTRRTGCQQPRPRTRARAACCRRDPVQVTRELSGVRNLEAQALLVELVAELEDTPVVVAQRVALLKRLVLQLGLLLLLCHLPFQHCELLRKLLGQLVQVLVLLLQVVENLLPLVHLCKKAGP